MALPLFVRVGTFGVAMASLALFIDGAYAAKLAERHRVWVDYEKLSARVTRDVGTAEGGTLIRLRTYFYDALPYQGNPPLPKTLIDSARDAGSSTHWKNCPSSRCARDARFDLRADQCDAPAALRSGFLFVRRKAAVSIQQQTR